MKLTDLRELPFDELLRRLNSADISATNARLCLGNIMRRAREVDAEISAGLYNGGDDRNDRPPTGDDYNDLFEAILDEISAVLADDGDGEAKEQS